jgi:WKF domain
VAYDYDIPIIIGVCQRLYPVDIMPSATIHNAPTHIPAWKRLGLKLKSQGTSDPVSESSVSIESFKRKIESALDEGPAKKTKKTSPSPTAPVTPVLSHKKSVTFTPETKVDDGDSIKQLFNSWVAEQKSQDPSFQLQNSQPAFETPEPSKVVEQVDTTLDEKERRAKRVKKPKQGKDNKQNSKNPSNSSKIFKPTIPSSRPYLQYLRQYHESRETWKFNKNHQSHLLKHVFDIDIIPSDHAHLIFPYVRGLQGSVRTRLRDAALAVKVKDQEEGVAGFPEDMAAPDKKQREYDAAMKEYVATMTAVNASSKMGYEEGVLLGLSDAAMAKRVAKRTRAEQILAELGTSQDGSEITDKDMNGDNDSQKRLRMNDGSSQKVARKRKQRTVTVDDETSSSDSGDSDDDTSDESTAENDRGDDTSSSSSSSSSGSDSEEDSQEGSEDSSEDSEDDDE